MCEEIPIDEAADSDMECAPEPEEELEGYLNEVATADLTFWGPRPDCTEAGGDSAKERSKTSHLAYPKKDTALQRFFEIAGSYPLLDRQREAELAGKVKDGDEQALKLMVLSNLRLVIKMARRYTGRGLDFEDLVQEGNFGLFRAAELYDPGKGTRFSTYACMWIVQFLSRAVDNKARAIRLPVGLHQDIRTVRRKLNYFKRISGKEPSVEQLARVTKLSPARVEKAMENMLSPISLNQESIAFSGVEVMERISEGKENEAESKLEQEYRQSLIEQLLDSLTPEEKEIMICRYGLFDRPQLSYEELSRSTGLPTEKLKRMHANAMSRLRRRSRTLRPKNRKDGVEQGRFPLPGTPG